MGDGLVLQGLNDSKSETNNNNKTKKKKKNKRGGVNKKKMTTEQTLALKSVSEWVFLDHPSPSPSPSPDSLCLEDDGFGVQTSTVGTGQEEKKAVFELHSHSRFSDGFLSPTKLVEKAHGNGVKVLALTDHDTMSGIPEALEAAHKYGIKIIPGVEISTIYSPRVVSEAEEPVHILAYYSSCGPTRFEELDKFLSNYLSILM